MTVINNDCNYKTLKMNTYPFPYLKADGFLETEFAKELQNEVLNIPNQIL